MKTNTFKVEEQPNNGASRPARSHPVEAASRPASKQPAARPSLSEGLERSQVIIRLIDCLKND